MTVECFVAFACGLFYYIDNVKYFWWLNFILRMVEGTAEAIALTTVSAIIGIEFTDNIDAYMSYLQMAWAFGMFIGPIIASFIYDYLGYAGTFYFFTGLIAVIGLTASIGFIPARINESK